MFVCAAFTYLILFSDSLRPQPLTIVGRITRCDRGSKKLSDNFQSGLLTVNDVYMR